MFATPAGGGSSSDLLLGYGDYNIPKSFRVREGQNCKFTKTFATTQNATDWAISCWVKFVPGAQKVITLLSTTIFAGGSEEYIYLHNGQGLTFADGAAGIQLFYAGNLSFDPSAWYHILFVYSSGQASAYQRARLYVNGERIYGSVNIAQNRNSYTNGSGRGHAIGNYASWNQTVDGAYIAEYHFVHSVADVQPTDFGFFQPETNQWRPKPYSRTYGTNGFYLKFSDNSSAANMGLDYSGNGNHFTPSSVYSDPSLYYTNSVLDTPTNPYPTLLMYSGLTSGYDAGLFVGNSSGLNDWYEFLSSMEMRGGKWYAEARFSEPYVAVTGPNPSTHVFMGIRSVDEHSRYNYYPGNTAGSYGWQGSGLKWNNGANSAYGSATGTYGDILQIAYDGDNNKVYFGKNGTWFGSADPASGLNPAFTTAAGAYRFAFAAFCSQGYQSHMKVNFGQRSFSYTPPSGFKPLNLRNISDPKILLPGKYFSAQQYLGTGRMMQVGDRVCNVEPVEIANSLRFYQYQSAYLSRTLPVAFTGQTKFTWSGWVKRAKLYEPTGSSAADGLYNAVDGVGQGFRINFSGNGALNCNAFTSASSIYWGAYTDSNNVWMGDWLHVHVVIDTTLAAQTDRIQFYMNGVRQGIAGVHAWPVQNSAIPFLGNTSYPVYIGRSIDSASVSTYFEGYMAELNIIPGVAAAPTEMGQWGSDGRWLPKTYAGSYGSYGCHLEFSDTSGLTATTVGKDTSGNGTNFTPNGFQTTDFFVDTPTNRYPIMNALTPTANEQQLTPYYGGLYATAGTGMSQAVFSQGIDLGIVTGGKFYFEVYVNQIATLNGYFYPGIILYGMNAASADLLPVGNMYANGTIGTCMIDFDRGEYYVGFNGPPNMAAPAGYFSKIVYEKAGGYRITPSLYNGGAVTFNFGASAFLASGMTYYSDAKGWFRYAPPTGAKSFCDDNLKEYLYDVEKPDALWIKCRDLDQNHTIYDSVRGPSRQLFWYYASGAEQRSYDGVMEFNKGGFTIGGDALVNTANKRYVALSWKAPADKTPKMDIVNFTKTTSAQTFNHNLGVKPDFMFLKNLVTQSGYWVVYHKNMAAAPASGWLTFTGAGGFAATASIFNGVEPTATQFTLGSGCVNEEWIGYLFSEVPGYSKFGKYTGNGGSNMVYTGFKPALILIKEVTGPNVSGTSWIWVDNARTPYNINGTIDKLTPSFNWAENNTTNVGAASANVVQFLSNGFRLTTANSNTNESGGEYVYAAFAEAPFKYANAAP